MTAESPIRGLAMLGLDELHPSPNNPRERLTDIDELAASILEVGIIQPIVVQKVPGLDGFQIVAGHRRHLAAKKARLDKVPCVVRRDMLPDEELLTMLVENGQQRKRENPVARPVGRPKGAKTKPYFGDEHPLAQAVRARCSHRGSPKVGGVGCGPCWESVVRTDVIETALADQEAS